MHELRTLKGRVEALRDAAMFEKSTMAQAVLEESLAVMEAQFKRIQMLESRLDAIQHGKGAINGT